MKKAWVLSYLLSAQRSLWSDWADAQADLSWLGAQSFCWFCHEVAQLWKLTSLPYHLSILRFLFLLDPIVISKKFYIRKKNQFLDSLHSLSGWGWCPTHLSLRSSKPTKWPVCPAKTLISLGICPVWSESSLCAQWVAQYTRFLHADS